MIDHMVDTLVVGWDPSTKSAAWACLRVSAGRRTYVSHGECDSHGAVEAQLKLLRAAGAALVGVEAPQGIHTKKDDAKAARARGVALMKTSGIASSIVTTARMLGYDVLEMTPDQCRSQIGMRRSPSDRAIKQALRVLVPTWPTRTNDHNRDAAVCALAAAMRWRYTAAAIQALPSSPHPWWSS